MFEENLPKNEVSFKKGCLIMKNSIVILAGLSMLLLGFSYACLADKNADKPIEQNFLSSLKKGDKIVVKEEKEKYHLQIIFDSTAFTHTIIEKGNDYLLLSDRTEIIEIRIPVYSIKAITKFKK